MGEGELHALTVGVMCGGAGYGESNQTVVTVSSPLVLTDNTEETGDSLIIDTLAHNEPMSVVYNPHWCDSLLFSYPAGEPPAAVAAVLGLQMKYNSLYEIFVNETTCPDCESDCTRDVSHERAVTYKFIRSPKLNNVYIIHVTSYKVVPLYK